MDNKNRIIIDWLTFTTRRDTLDSIFGVIGLSADNFIKLPKGYNGYKSCLYYEGISVCYDGTNNFVDKHGVVHDMGIMVNMSGKGCRAFEEYSNKSFADLFAYINARLDDYNITRLDVAYDDFEGLLDINQIASDVMQGNFVSRFKNFGVDWSSVSGTVGYTVYFGSQKSDMMYRVYDKRAEQKIIDDSMHWVRFEVQCRDGHAATFVGLLCQGVDIGQLFFESINNNLRFVVPNPNDTNKRRWSTAPYWLKFIEFDGRISLYQAPGVEFNDDNLINYLNTYSGSLYTFCSMFGLQRLITILSGIDTDKLNIKYKAYLQSNGVDFRSLKNDLSNYLDKFGVDYD